MSKPEYANGRPVRHPTRQQRLARAKALGWEASRPGEEGEPKPPSIRRKGMAAGIVFIGGILLGCLGFVVPYSAYGVPVGWGLFISFVALIVFYVQRCQGRWFPDGTSIWLTLLGIAVIVALPATVSAVREHAQADASGSFALPSSSQPVTDGIYSGTLTGATLSYDAQAGYTSLNLDLTDLDRWTPQLNATVTASNGQTLECDMSRSHQAENGDSSIEEVPCDSTWDLAQIRLATGLDVTGGD